MSREMARKAMKGHHMVSVKDRDFFHQDDDGGVWLPCPFFVVDARPLNWFGNPVKYGHYVKLRSEFDGRELCVMSKELRLVTDVLRSLGTPWDDYQKAVNQHIDNAAEAAKKREENAVAKAHNILAVSQLLKELGVDLIDDDDDFKFAISEEMHEELKACGVEPIPNWLGGYSIAATLLHAIGVLDLDDLKRLHS